MGLLNVNTSSFTGGMFGLLNSLFFWAILLVVVIVAVFGLLIIRKNRKLSNSVLEITSLGRGRLELKPVEK